MSESKRSRMIYGRKGQLMLEYAIVFTVVVSVIIWASLSLFRPAVNRFFRTSSGIINQATDRVENAFPTP